MHATKTVFRNGENRVNNTVNVCINVNDGYIRMPTVYTVKKYYRRLLDLEMFSVDPKYYIRIHLTI